MQKWKAIMILGMLVLSAGCIQSLHPLYTEEDIIFEPSLIGQWAKNSEEIWAFSEGDLDAYTLVVTDKKGKQGKFDVHLLKIKGKMFLDFFPAELDLKQNEFYQLHMLPVHTFAYIEQIEPTLEMSFSDPNWLKKLIADNPEAIRHEKIDDEIILTASTKALQTFLLKHLDAEGIFFPVSGMERKKTTVLEEQPNKADTGDGK